MARYVVVGQGIAGSLLSYFLYKNRQNFVVYDPGLGSATSAAGGLLNPITGKQFAKSWMADTLMPFAKTTYRELEQLLQVSFYHERRFLKVLQNVKEQNDYFLRAADEGYSAYFPNPGVVETDAVLQPFGCIEVNGCAQLSTPVFLPAYRSFLRQHQFLVEENWEAAKKKDDDIVIYCDGYMAQQPEHPFSYLPWQLAKGEHLLVRLPHFPKNTIIKGATMLAPTADAHIFYAGATYQWHFETLLPTEEKRVEILSSLKKMLPFEPEITGAGAGVRPAVRDRRPLIGRHPEQSDLYLFNGLGTKGFSLAPYFAQELAAHLLHQQPLTPEINLQRFSKV
ncbi:MAG: FAD-dependent oxidoreductase [Chitinophagales bacterium]